MYDRQKDANGVFKPGPCAKYDATKMPEQSSCAHPLESLKWGANESSMYAGCTICGLKTCIMYKKNRAFVTGVEVVEKHEVHLVTLKAGLVMIDTGCRAAVGGKKYHQDLQKRLEDLGKMFSCEKQEEYFQFGPGDPIRSSLRWRYQVGVQGVNRELVMSEVPVDCPGLIGPEELTAWNMLLDFRTKTFTTDVGVPTPITFAKSGHPCMSLLAYEEDEDTKEIYQTDRLEEEDQDSGSDLEKLLSRTSANVEHYNIAEEDLDFESSTSEESSHAWTSEAEKSDSEAEEDVELGVYTTKQPDLEDMKFMSKGDFRHVKAAVKNIQEGMSEEKKLRKQKPVDIERPLKIDGGPRRPGPWRFLEIFTWTCVISMVAHRTACWETLSPSRFRDGTLSCRRCGFVPGST